MIVILGGGLAGLSTGYHLEKAGYGKYAIFEKDSIVGGVCRSEEVDGFTFDYTGHFLHFTTEEMKKLVLELLGENIQSLERDSWIYSKNVFTPYPFQQHTYGLPPEVIKQCILGLIEAKYEYKGNGDPQAMPASRNFKEWIYRTFGRGIAEHFMVPYNEKLWTVPVEEMTCDWMGRFIPQPSLEDVLDGALTAKKKKIGYNAVLWYPLKGGIQSLPQAFLSHVSSIRLNLEAVEIDFKRKTVIFNDGSKVYYQHLVSTMPLTQLVKISEQVPGPVKEAARRLRHNAVFNVNFGIANRKVSDKHWIYVPENNYIFYRIGFPHNFSPYQVPDGCSAVNVEISYTREKPLKIEEAIVQARADLLRMQILKKSDKIVVEKCLHIPCAYVIYDKNHNECVRIIQNFLKENGIYSVGRYGAWEYSSMEDAILHGKRIAEALLAIEGNPKESA